MIHACWKQSTPDTIFPKSQDENIDKTPLISEADPVGPFHVTLSPPKSCAASLTSAFEVGHAASLALPRPEHQAAQWPAGFVSEAASYLQSRPRQSP
jgi:hypothetical protein